MNTLILVMLMSFCNSCNKELKDYWYNNEAEISSYELEQARYGEIHKGKAVLLYVTEPFSIISNTKADNPSGDDVSVLKLNFTKNFNTGIYPYSMMTSTFFPFKIGTHSLKVSSSTQEWCGQTYLELKNQDQFEIQYASYFEGESDHILLEKKLLEDDLWTRIRLDPDNLPLGRVDMIPSFFYLRLAHKNIKAYQSEITSTHTEDGNTIYSIQYPELQRTLSITFQSNFPHKILSWEEEYQSGFGENSKKLTTKARLLKTIKSDYWNHHSNKDHSLRTELMLD